eukprot:11224414-Lingulodinium_polyedra.AAC.1
MVRTRLSRRQPLSQHTKRYTRQQVNLGKQHSMAPWTRSQERFSFGKAFTEWLRLGQPTFFL